MNEINNPEQRLDKSSVEKTPEQLRSAESAKAQIHDRLDNAGTREPLKIEFFPEIAQISDADREKLSHWKYKPDEQLYLEHKKVYDNPKYFNQETGEINWPPNGGAVGETYTKTLQPGEVIDRYGLDTGYYVSPLGVSYEKRALAPGTEKQPYSQFEVAKSFDVSTSEVAPWFDQPGGGIQYKTPDSVGDLIDDGYIRRI